jgi:hypothetical protein
MRNALPMGTAAMGAIGMTARTYTLTRSAHLTGLVTVEAGIT